jgi:hypothetical protein
VQSRKFYPADGIYVGREVRDRRTGEIEWEASPFGNHFGKNGDAFRKYAVERMQLPYFRAKVEALRGKDLLCWHDHDYAGFCHAKVWLELANETGGNK